MENKTKRILLLLILLFPAFELFAQAENYYIQDTSEGAVFVQTFRWEANDYVSKYVFTIEKLSKRGKWEQIDKKETEFNYIEQTLSAGEYRYKLELYNFLGIMELETEWQPVLITKAYQPKISDVSPGIIYLEEEQDGVFTVDGSELSDTTEFVLKAGKKELKSTVIQSNSRKHSVKLQFDPDELDTGKYNLVAKNIGGLTYTYPDIRIQFKKMMDFDVSGGYAPLIVVADDTMKTYFGQSFFLLGLNNRLTFIPLKRKAGYFGVSLSNTAYFTKNDDSKYSLSSMLLFTHLDFTFQKQIIEKKLMFDAHVGGGFTSFINMYFEFPNEIYSERFFGFYPQVAAGVDLEIYVSKRLYIEVGVDYSCTLNITTDGSGSTFIHGIIPMISCGWQF